MRVLVARIGRPHGLAGHVAVHILTDEPELRLALGVTVVMASGTAETSTQILGSRRVSGRLVLRLSGVSDRSAAESIRGADLFAEVDPAVRPAGDDEWYDHQLIGLPCRRSDDESLGEVVAIEHPPGHDLLVVRLADEREVRVPFVSAIVPVVDESGLVIDPPKGLFDDEAAETTEVQS